MNIRNVGLNERLWFKNKIIHCGSDAFDLTRLQKILVQVSDLSFVDDTVRLNLDFGDTALIVPSYHKSYDILFEKLSKSLPLDEDTYVRAMNCDRCCDFTIFQKQSTVR